jgi:hypothetical protein
MRLDPQEMRRAAVTVNALLLFGHLAQLIVFHPPWANTLVVARLAQIALSTTLLVGLLAGRWRVSLRMSQIAYALPVVAQLVTYWVIGAAREASGQSWEPLWRQKVLSLLLAILSPGELPITATLILAIGAEAFLEVTIGGLGDSPSLGAGEPWIMLALTAASLGILIYRRQRQRVERLLVDKAREAEAFERLARVAVAVRDLANTPIQLLEFSLDVLVERHPDLQRDFERMRRAVQKLRGLNRLLEPYERGIHWRPDVESPDSASLLRELSAPPH